jgi:hypothetical protein
MAMNEHNNRRKSAERDNANEDLKGLKAKTQKDLAGVTRCAPIPQDEAVYRFLDVVYRVYTKWHGNRSVQAELNLIREGLAAPAPKSIPHMIILLGAPEVDSRKRYKYANALEYAFHSDVKPKDLVRFIKEEGGINACVQSNASGRVERRRRRQKTVNR